MEIKMNNFRSKDIMRFIREATDLTQEEFGKAIGKKGRSWANKVENGVRNVYLEDFLKVANVFDIEITIKMNYDKRNGKRK